jgi:hypothetical protein
VSDEPRDATLEGLLELFGQAMRRGMFTSEPGRIVDYDATKRRASVLLMNQRSHVDENQKRVVESVAQVHNVPIVFLGAPGRGITWPVRAGDDCLLWFASSSTARWKVTGKPGDPGDDRTHDLTDCFAMVCPFFGQFDAPTDAVVTHGATRLGDPGAIDDKYKVVIRDTLAKFMTVLGGVADTAGACTALHDALAAAGWPNDWVATLVKAK